MDTYLDDGTARTAAETWTINGGILTIRTDTRCHAGSPASMVGVLGSTTVSATLGGGVLLDGRNVRELAFDTGSGTAPAIGTSITQGAVTGYLLGVYEDHTTPPIGPAINASSVNTTNNQITIGSNQFYNGMKCHLSSSGTLPSPLVASTDYYIYFASTTEITIHTSKADALTGANPIDITTSGSGTHTITPRMPATGFLKFREVTGGTFTAGALTGISANATGADVVGWMEVVFNQSSNLTIPRLGSGFVVRGKAYEIGTTNGSAGQTFQVPTNGGGSGTHTGGVFIETSPGSGTYEFYPSLALATGWTTSNLTTDQRAKFVESVGNGVVRIGSDGTDNIGYVPASGCKVVIPNVIGRQCATATRNQNATPHTTLGSRPEFITTSGGAIDFDWFTCDWYTNFTNAFNVTMKNTIVDGPVYTTNIANLVTLENGGNGSTVSVEAYGYQAQTCITSGSTINKWKAVFRVSIGSVFTNCSGWVVNDLESYSCMGVARTTSGYNPYVAYCNGMTFNRVKARNGYMYINASNNITVNDYDFIDRMEGDTTSTSPIYGMYIVASTNVLVNGYSIGDGNVLNNTHPAAGFVYTSANLGNIVVNGGMTISTPLSGGTDPLIYPQYLFRDAGNNIGVTFRRFYCDNLRTNNLLQVNTSKGTVLENVGGEDALGQVQLCNEGIIRGAFAGYSATGQASVYGSHFIDQFISTTVGNINVLFNEPTPSTASYVTTSGTAQFTSVGSISMPALNDRVIQEMSFYALGHTGFGATAVAISGTLTGNMDYEYDIDTGSGFSGTYTTLNATNLQAESINSTDGFKLRIRITTNTADPTNLVSNIRIYTTTTSTDIANALYPDGTITIEGANETDIVKAYVYDPLDSDPTTNILLGTRIGSGTLAINASSYLGEELYVIRYTSDNVRIMSTRSQPIEITSGSSGTVKVYAGDEIQVAVDIQDDITSIKTLVDSYLDARISTRASKGDIAALD